MYHPIRLFELAPEARFSPQHCQNQTTRPSSGRLGHLLPSDLFFSCAPLCYLKAWQYDMGVVCGERLTVDSNVCSSHTKQ